MRKSRYDVALSYAGQERWIAYGLAQHLRPHYRVFLDIETTRLWGESLIDALPDIYLRSRACVLLVSHAYIRKMWPTLERRVIVKKVSDANSQALMLPVRVGGFGGTVDEIGDDQWIPFEDENIAYLAARIHERLQST